MREREGNRPKAPSGAALSRRSRSMTERTSFFMSPGVDPVEEDNIARFGQNAGRDGGCILTPGAEIQIGRIPPGPAGDGQRVAAVQAGRQRRIGHIVVMLDGQGAGVFDDDDFHEIVIRDMGGDVKIRSFRPCNTRCPRNTPWTDKFRRKCCHVDRAVTPA